MLTVAGADNLVTDSYIRKPFSSLLPEVDFLGAPHFISAFSFCVRVVFPPEKKVKKRKKKRSSDPVLPW